MFFTRREDYTVHGWANVRSREWHQLDYIIYSTTLHYITSSQFLAIFSSRVFNIRSIKTKSISAAVLPRQWKLSRGEVDAEARATLLSSPFVIPLSPSFYLSLPYSRCLAWGLRFPPQPQSLPTLPQGPKCSRIRDVEIMWLEYFHPASRKSGSADCLFEGKEASAKHPVLKSLPGFCSTGAAQLPLWRQGEAEECWREGQRPGGDGG